MMQIEYKKNVVATIKIDRVVYRDSSGGGTNDHRILTHRDAINQHPISSITDLQTVLDGKSAINHNHNLNDLSEKSYNSLTDKPELFDGSYNSLSDVPTEFVPTLHNHSIANITDLQTVLNGKEPLKSSNDNYVTDAQLVVISNTSGTNTGDQDLSGLQPKENGKGLSTNDYIDADKALVATIPDKADIGHTHAISDVTNLQTTLSTKSDTSHNHNLADLAEKSYNSLTDKPTLFSGSYTDLSNVPNTFTPSSHNQAISTIDGLQTALDGKSATTHNHTLSSLSEKSYNSLTDKPTIPTNFDSLYYTKSEIDIMVGDIETLLGAI